MFDVITFGSAVVDVFVDTKTAEKGKFMYYPIGEKILIKNLKFYVGGGGTNTAVAFSRLGLKTGFVGKVGDDNSEKKILELLKKEKVKFLGKIEKGAVSGYSIVLESREKDRTILTYKGVNDKLKFKELKLKELKTKWLYLSALLGESFKTQKKLVQHLNKKGTKIAFNPSSYIIKKLDLKIILKFCEILVLNKEEAQMFVKKGDLLEGLRKLGPRIVIITDRDKLISAYDGNKKYYLKPNKIKVVDRTGAGDAFASGFVAGRITGKSIGDSLKLGLRESEAEIKYHGVKNKLLRMKLK
ncbi:carbohydrate kinase family protein [Candidatus Pacearchaeota archaeon]|nr:carbohydrate kinase family protein [Candidatus Pacearchaeota archaeon]